MDDPHPIDARIPPNQRPINRDDRGEYDPIVGGGYGEDGQRIGPPDTSAEEGAIAVVSKALEVLDYIANWIKQWPASWGHAYRMGVEKGFWEGLLYACVYFAPSIFIISLAFNMVLKILGRREKKSIWKQAVKWAFFCTIFFAGISALSGQPKGQ